MNANELADKLQSKIFCGEYGEHTDWLISDAVDMLRQQQAEIEALKAKTLTDEDYMILGLRFMQWNREQKEPLVKIAYEQYVFEQAIAILRKANEK